MNAQRTQGHRTFENRYDDELGKFVGKTVEVIDFFGNKHVGFCMGISFVHLNLILSTSTEKILIKNPQVVRRRRIPRDEFERLHGTSNGSKPVNE